MSHVVISWSWQCPSFVILSIICTIDKAKPAFFLSMDANTRVVWEQMLSPRVVNITLPAPKRNGSSKAGVRNSMPTRPCEAHLSAELLKCTEGCKQHIGAILAWCWLCFKPLEGLFAHPAGTGSSQVIKNNQFFCEFLCFFFFCLVPLATCRNVGSLLT